LSAVRAVPEPAAPAPAFVPLCAPELAGNEWRYVKECLDTGWVSSVGSYVERFEAAVAGAVGARHAVATASGTAALHTALVLLGVEPDDEVVVSTLTFIAPANAIRYVGAWPVFIDAEPAYWQMDPAKLEQFLTEGCEVRGGVLVNRTTGRRVRAVIPVHVLGHPVDMEPVLDLARRFGLPVIEDATESLGATCRDRPVGRFGDVACFSFNGNKLITTGGGGMLVTDDPALTARAKYLTTQAKDDPIEFVHGAVGYNYRLTNVQAAIGVAQMERLDGAVAAKRRIAERYASALAAVPGLTLMRQAPWAASVFWMYTVLIEPRAFGMDSRELIRRLDAERIQCRPLWQPIHLSPAHQPAFAVGGEVARTLNERAVSLPCSVGLSAGDQDRVIGAVTEAADARTAKAS
jgi:perosamine synthetase